MTDKTNEVKSLQATLRLRNQAIENLQDELARKAQEIDFLRQVIIKILKIN